MSGWARRATHLRERMDTPECDRARLFRTYRQFARLNHLCSGWRGLYTEFLRPLAAHAGRPVRLLDIGFGGGDIPSALCQWAEEDGLSVDVCAIEQDPRALAFAAGLPARRNLHFRRASTQDLLREGATFDIVVSNHLLHHLDDREVRALIRDVEALCTGVVLLNDLRRSRLAYGIFALVAPFLFRNSYVVEDGRCSVRRSFTAAELRALLPPGWTVERRRPFRVVAMCRAGSAR